MAPRVCKQKRGWLKRQEGEMLEGIAKAEDGRGVSWLEGRMQSVEKEQLMYLLALGRHAL